MKLLTEEMAISGMTHNPEIWAKNYVMAMEAVDQLTASVAKLEIMLRRERGEKGLKRG